MGGPSMSGSRDKLDAGNGVLSDSTKEDNARARALFGEVLKAQGLDSLAKPLASQAKPPDPQLAARACAELAATYRQDWNFEWTADDPS